MENIYETDENNWDFLLERIIIIRKFNRDMKKLRFYKEDTLWYIDLPEFLEEGLGTKNNLLMVDGADLLLDHLSGNNNEIELFISDTEKEGYEIVEHLYKRGEGLNQQLLGKVGHAPVDSGMYYQTTTAIHINHVWLCPVTKYVFKGIYPDDIYIWNNV